MNSAVCKGTHTSDWPGMVGQGFSPDTRVSKTIKGFTGCGKTPDSRLIFF
jgi:hypothetical protein